MRPGQELASVLQVFLAAVGWRPTTRAARSAGLNSAPTAPALSTVGRLLSSKSVAGKATSTSAPAVVISD